MAIECNEHLIRREAQALGQVHMVFLRSLILEVPCVSCVHPAQVVTLRV